MGNPFGNIGGMGGMMKQAKKMMEAVQKAQEELAEERVEATSGGGMVKAIANGQGDLVGVKIDPQVVDPEDIEMLEDLVTTAVREVLAKAKQLQADRMNEATGGLAGGLSGMF
ncbi:MAG: YbaB/EbfC family nucleoid-associated protein [Armatimonadetes bacterium]|nr:YbaB/EbfC family nucleoid-associated protein [Armatimonadota bacterium]